MTLLWDLFPLWHDTLCFVKWNWQWFSTEQTLHTIRSTDIYSRENVQRGWILFISYTRSRGAMTTTHITEYKTTEQQSSLFLSGMFEPTWWSGKWSHILHLYLICWHQSNSSTWILLCGKIRKWNFVLNLIVVLLLNESYQQKVSKETRSCSKRLFDSWTI